MAHSGPTTGRRWWASPPRDDPGTVWARSRPVGLVPRMIGATAPPDRRGAEGSAEGPGSGARRPGRQREAPQARADQVGQDAARHPHEGRPSVVDDPTELREHAE